MHFFYTDESGDTGKNLDDPEQPIFVMGGISVRDQGWNETREKLQTVLEGFFGGKVPADFELHSHELLSPNGNGPFAGYSMDDRTALARELLKLVAERKHSVHYIAFHKPTVKSVKCGLSLEYNPSIPYLLGFDYLVTYINWFTRERLGSSARALMVLDEKQQHDAKIINLFHYRRFGAAKTKRVKWIVDVTYSVDSYRNPMIQLSDLVIFVIRRFLEIEHGYRNQWPDEAKSFYAECFSVVEDRVCRKGIVSRCEKKLERLDEYLDEVRCQPKGQWRNRYGL